MKAVSRQKKYTDNRLVRENINFRKDKDLRIFNRLEEIKKSNELDNKKPTRREYILFSVAKKREREKNGEQIKIPSGFYAHIPPSVSRNQITIYFKKEQDAELLSFLEKVKIQGTKVHEYLRDALSELVYLETLDNKTELPKRQVTFVPCYLDLNELEDTKIIEFLDSFKNREERDEWIKKSIEENMKKENI